MTWQRDKRWSDLFIPEITPILGQYLIGPAPEEDDALRNSDLMVLKMDSVRIGCRIRRHCNIDLYGEEFTIRMSRPSENKTEFTKIIEGWGDYFFYGFSDKQESSLERYHLCDLKVFRLAVMRMLVCGKNPWNIMHNHDGSSTFAVFKWSDFPDNFILTKYPL